MWAVTLVLLALAAVFICTCVEEVASSMRRVGNESSDLVWGWAFAFIALALLYAAVKI